MSRFIYPTFPLISFRVGLSSTSSFDASDVAGRWALDRAEQRISRVDRVDQRTMINHINTCYLKGVITVRSNATWLTEERRSSVLRTTRSIRSTCVNWSVITAEINRRGSHLSYWIATQGAKIKRFYNAY